MTDCLHKLPLSPEVLESQFCRVPCVKCLHVSVSPRLDVSCMTACILLKRGYAADADCGVDGSREGMVVVEAEG